MINKTLAILALVSLQGCATVQSWIPSFWDDNQSASIINVRQKVEQINCDQPQAAQVEAVAREIRWFELYSESKGFAQKDVLRVVEPMTKITEEWVKRGEGSKGYCQIKKKMLTQGSTRAAEVILGRW